MCNDLTSVIGSKQYREPAGSPQVGGRPPGQSPDSQFELYTVNVKRPTGRHVAEFGNLIVRNTAGRFEFYVPEG